MHRIVASLVAGLVVMVASQLQVGCAATQTAPTRVDWKLALSVRLPGHQFLFFQVLPSGTIGFAGGHDALNERVTWTDDLTDEELNSLQTLLKDERWFTAPPASTGVPPDISRTVRVSRNNRTTSHTVLGTSAVLEELQAILHGISRRQHEAVLDQLPKAGRLR